MNEINIFANQVAISLVLVSAALFLAQRLLQNLLSKIIFCVVGFFVLLVPFLDFSLSGYVYALFGTPSVLLVMVSVWSGVWILIKDSMFLRQIFGNEKFWKTKNYEAKNCDKKNWQAKNCETKSGEAKFCDKNMCGKNFWQANVKLPFFTFFFFDYPLLNFRAKIVIFVVCLAVYLEFLGGSFSISGLLSLCGFGGRWLDFYYADYQAVVLWFFAFFAYFISKCFGVSLVCALLVYYSKILGDLPAWDYCFDVFLWAYCGVSVACAFGKSVITHYKIKNRSK